MDQSTLEPTLDHQRTDQLRTFLTVEAAADAAGASTVPARRARRLVGGIAAALVLGAGLFAAASITGGPGTGPTAVQTASAVTIEPAGAGWTRISIADVDADPDAVVAELRSAGIQAERAPLAVSRDEEGRVTLGSFDDQEHGSPGFTMVGVGSQGEQGLAGLSVSSPSADPAPLSEGLSNEEAGATFHAYLEDLGARTGDNGALEIRNDADVTVLVLTED